MPVFAPPTPTYFPPPVSSSNHEVVVIGDPNGLDVSLLLCIMLLWLAFWILFCETSFWRDFKHKIRYEFKMRFK